VSCHWIERTEIFEGYLKATLPPQEQEAFEEHYFECAACFEMLQTYRALQAEIGTSVASMPAIPEPRPRMSRWWFAIARAAALVLIAGFTWWLRNPASIVPPQPELAAGTPVQAPPTTAPAPLPPEKIDSRTQSKAPPTMSLTTLAQVEPAVYIPSALRGSTDDATERFQVAMRRYVDGDYEGAIPGLQAAMELNSKAPHVAFFLAISNRLTGRLEPAIADLERAIALGESPYLEEAHFYLAQSRLRQGSVQATRAEL
jgi:hypothetical protein